MKIGYSGEVLPVDCYIEDGVYLGDAELFRYSRGRLRKVDRPPVFVFRDLTRSKTYIVYCDSIRSYRGECRVLDCAEQAFYKVRDDEWRHVCSLSRPFIGFRAVGGTPDKRGAFIDWIEDYDVCNLFDPDMGIARIYRDGMYRIDITLSYRLDPVGRFELLRNGEVIGTAVPMSNTGQVVISGDYYLCCGDRLRLYYRVEKPKLNRIDLAETQEITGNYSGDLLVYGTAPPGETVEFTAQVDGDVIFKGAEMNSLHIDGEADRFIFMDTDIVSETLQPTTNFGIEIDSEDVEIILRDNNTIIGVPGGIFYEPTTGRCIIKICGDNNIVRGSGVGSERAGIFTDSRLTLYISGDDNNIGGLFGVSAPIGEVYICGDHNIIVGTGMWGITFADSGYLCVSGNHNYIEGGNNVMNPVPNYASVYIDRGNIDICGDYNIFTGGNGISIGVGVISICGDKNRFVPKGVDSAGISVLAFADSTVKICGHGNASYSTGGAAVYVPNGKVIYDPDNRVTPVNAEEVVVGPCKCDCDCPCDCESENSYEVVWSLHKI